MTSLERRKVVVVGAGAAGIMAAIFAARAGACVTMLESTSDGGRKILISGGGRCNILPSELDPTRYVTDSSRNTLRKILLSWPLAGQREFFEAEVGIALALEPETGKLFPASNRARDVRDGLLRLARDEGVTMRFGTRVSGLARDARANWTVATDGAPDLICSSVVLATGGLSVPKTGSDGFGLRLLTDLGHTIHPTYPALTPLTADPPVHAALAGVSLRARLSAPPPGGPFESEGGFLFTHRGYSGPAVLNISHVAVRAGNSADQPIHVRWGDIDPDTLRRTLTGGGGRTVSSVLRPHLPTRLVDQLLAMSGVDGERPLAQLRREERDRVLHHFTDYRLPWGGDEGYRKAEVTGGGVSLGEVYPATLESKVAGGLFLCGELLDAFGPIGGYNFAWAWATGRAAGRAAGERALATKPEDT
jgi:predicted Rossmann fold flavoprotein